MNYVIDTLRRKDDMERLPVIKMEIDYELLTLYDAMEATDHVQTAKTKVRLEHLRLELLRLEGK